MAAFDRGRGRSVGACAGAGRENDAGLDPAALWLACSNSPAFFIDRCVQLYDPTGSEGGAKGWQPFRLWPAQVRVVETLAADRLCVILKARQLGISWLTVGFALWHMIFRPAATALFFSKRDDEAVHLLNMRLRGMYERLPRPLRAAGVERDNAHEFRLSNGSAALAFPTTGGRSYTASIAIVDEADHVSGGAGSDDLDQLLNAVKPTIDAGGRLILLSTVDKARPESAFKRIYRAAAEGRNGYQAIFLPWRARPGRTDAWYAEQAQDVRMRTGGVDDLYQEYPATVAEALAPRAVDKLFRAEYLNACYQPQVWDGVTASEDGACETPRPDLPELIIHAPPVSGGNYVIGADPAEGNPESDESAAVVLDAITGEQMATLGERTDPVRFAAHLSELSRYYNEAPVLVERNNHGHAVLLWLREMAAVWVLRGQDREPGWMTTGASKHMAFDHAAATIREGGLLLRDERTFFQMAAIDGNTLKAPPGQHDDRAMACALALAAIKWCSVVYVPGAILPPCESMRELESGEW